MSETSMQLPVNFRDVAIITNQHSHRIRLRCHHLYRSSRLLHTTFSSLPPLTTNLDLRTRTELLLFPPPPSTPFTHTPTNLLTPRYQLYLISHLPFPYILLLVVYLLFLPRAYATRLISTHVLTPLGLTKITTLTLSLAAKPLVGVLRLLASGESYPVCVSCTVGKDRTGLVVMMVMMILGVEEEVVVKEYVESEGEIMAERGEAVRREMMGVGGGLGEEWAWAREETVRGVVEELRRGWGGVEGWCEWAGFGVEERRRLRSVLVEREYVDGVWEEVEELREEVEMGVGEVAEKEE
ncbi:hypothetical protein EX30DRAFT_397312 [Ascodesmis nigricans]|uniref:Tyrosine specific protein phosphatases domain-containing protein n=1 Tax=Ascodesmis nigricans TaxID=341454 RepID=A0A4S2MPT5_9PEZI|nr:hypothetical protein EX30DRAFT_397312 [Ascodesmis nigricans]